MGMNHCDRLGISRRGLQGEMTRAGLRLDDAVVATDIAIRAQMRQRDTLIIVARELGYSLRRIARFFDVDVAIVHRVLTRAGSVSTPPARTVSATAPEVQGG